MLPWFVMQCFLVYCRVYMKQPVCEVISIFSEDNVGDTVGPGGIWFDSMELPFDLVFGDAACRAARFGSD